MASPRSGPGAPATALLAALAAATAWYVLASATGLIFHFMPAAAPLAGAWVLRRVACGRTRPWVGLAVWAGSVALALAATAVIASSRLPLDDPATTAGVFGLGAVAGAWLLRRPTRAA